MRGIALAFAMILSAILPAAALAATCRLDVGEVVSTLPYFAKQMAAADGGGARSVAFAHKDDPRMVVVIGMSESKDDVGAFSRSDFVRRIEERAKDFSSTVRGRGFQPESSVFPYDPVAWRTVHMETVPGVGAARVSHMEIQITPDCLLVADAVAPDSINLTSRWSDMQMAIAGLREAASRFVVGSSFMRDKLVPTGLTALAGGILLPLAVIGILYALMGQMINLDPPETTTRIVLASSAAVTIGAAIFQRGVYLEGLLDQKFVDGGLLLIAIGVVSASGALMAQRGALLGLLFTLIGGITMAAAGYLDWTPDRNVTCAVAVTLVILGVCGLYAWSAASYAARLRRAGGGTRSPQQA